MCCQGEPGVVALGWSTGCVEMDRKGPEGVGGRVGVAGFSSGHRCVYLDKSGPLFPLLFFFFKGFKMTFMWGMGLFVPHCVWRSEQQLFRVGFLFLNGSWGSDANCLVWWQALYSVSHLDSPTPLSTFLTSACLVLILGKRSTTQPQPQLHSSFLSFGCFWLLLFWFALFCFVLFVFFFLRQGLTV